MKKTKTETKKTKESYGAKDIYVLEGLEPVRRRPGMYIGSTGSEGLHHLVWECVDNNIDEAIAGFCSEVEIILSPGNKVSTKDNGRGIPVDIHPQTKKSALETVMTTLHAGAKFGGKAYQVAGGLHGVGVSVVCALSKSMKAEICRNGIKYTQEYSKGKPITKVRKDGKCRHTGTTVIFEPDPEIFKDITFDLKKIINHLRQQAYLTKGIKIKIKDEREEKKKIYNFYFEGGLTAYVKHLIRGVEPKNDNIFYVSGEKDEILVETAFQYTQEYEVYEESFTNNIYTGEGGTHLTGFRAALTRGLNDYARKNSLIKEGDDNLSGEDVREGLTAVVSVKIKEPQFEGQTKAKLGNPEAKVAVETVVLEGLADFLERNPQDARAIIGSCLLSAKARKAARAARQTVLRKGALDGLALPGKLADCSSKDPEESEIYIVEGESAGGCFAENTKVALTDGRNLSFKELIEEDRQRKNNYCYTIKSDGSIGTELIKNPRKTKNNVEVMKIILDTGEEIICTPDHKFMLRDRNYNVAKDLTPGSSLMPLYRKFSEIGHKITIKGYEMVFDPAKHYYIFTHLLADQYNLERKKYIKKERQAIHHIDFNKINNNPDNIIRMDSKKHKEFHSRLITRLMSRPDIQEKIKKFHQSREYREKVRATMLKPAMREIFDQCGKIDKEKYNKERLRRNDKSIIRYETICERFFDRDEKKLKETVLNYNHKIKKIIKLKEKIDVYDLEVGGTHNFALASGIFVHNSAKGGRDRRFQAILPLRGKILNTERARLDKILDSKEIKSLIIALGTAIAEDFNLEKIRYHRVIIMCDADSDGNHIRTLLLTLFFRYFKQIIEAGYLYIAQPPLYKIQIGSRIEYAYTDSDKAEILSSIKEEKKKQQRKAKTQTKIKAQKEIIEEEKISGVNIQRYKGLGEMNPNQLWETTMDPKNRVLLKVNIENAKEADRIFDTLMGEEVLPRKKFIQTHAKKVKNLDI